MRFWQNLLALILFSTVPVLFLELLQIWAKTSSSWLDPVNLWVFVAAILLISWVTKPFHLEKRLWLLPWSGVVIFIALVLAVIMYLKNNNTLTAWIILAIFYILLLGLDTVFVQERSVLPRFVLRGMLALGGGVVPVLIAQIEANFSEEEFFSALQAFVLTFFTFLLLSVASLFIQKKPLLVRKGVHFNPRWLSILLILVVFFGLVVTAYLYQHSFYSPQALGYTGISPSTPFLCGQTSPDTQTFDGSRVFDKLLRRVEANPDKNAPEYGMLALARRELQWAKKFRQSLLNEADQKLFTGPAHSIKSVQKKAAFRIYYFSRIREVFPDLFSSDEKTKLCSWFAAINKRALTIEWVDLLYALAFAKFPEGPYENQENGSGLLAVLESTGLSAPDLSPRNRYYLNRNLRGWSTRFRNTDDAFVYQLEWIYNSFLQSRITDEISKKNLRHSFEWLLLQAISNGDSPRYNHPHFGSLAGIAYLGARLLHDTQYLWLSGRSLDYLEAQGLYLSAQPGLEQQIKGIGHSPIKGSCLLFGDSGLPNQVGPLAPDKIVFRDGWSEDATYMLLNLRFTGWHRYKGTNSVVLLHKNTPLVVEDSEGSPFTWLPKGRSLFRDKRIPRENLNGLLIERMGISLVLYRLMGIGSDWFQDPPHYARVEYFETGDERDLSTTILDDWHGWHHKRTIYFHHGGPIVVLDDAEGYKGQRAALTWHVIGEKQKNTKHLIFRRGERPAEMHLLPLGSGEIKVNEKRLKNSSSPLQVVHFTATGGRLNLITIFLTGKWVGAEGKVIQSAMGPLLQIVKGDEHIDCPIHTHE